MWFRQLLQWLTNQIIIHSKSDGFLWLHKCIQGQQHNALNLRFLFPLQYPYFHCSDYNQTQTSMIQFVEVQVRFDQVVL
ncbi:unnamed protein product [Schistosoma mattheei]|uniref:Uncharacterized protein n=1 Tax=Schistosoma mattheei TaxID=31246 RepID=A0A3P8DT30_9TREM|nr:unnamed protein product [Schistosoma mattheei]